MWHRVVGRAMCLASSSREGGVCVASSSSTCGSDLTTIDSRSCI